MEKEPEVWLPLQVNPKYHVSNHARVKSFRKDPAGEIISTSTRPDGYIQVSIIDDTKELYEEGRQILCYLHRMVATLHILNPKNLPEVNHKDRIKANCESWNLEWCTHQQNITHSFLTRTTKKGKDSPLFGRSYSADHKKALSDSKIGENHPKFKGYFVKNNTKYASSNIAATATGENGRTIIRNAAKGMNGWSFLPKQDPQAQVAGTPDQISNTVEWEISKPDTIPET